MSGSEPRENGVTSAAQIATACDGDDDIVMTNNPVGEKHSLDKEMDSGPPPVSKNMRSDDSVSHDSITGEENGPLPLSIPPIVETLLPTLPDEESERNMAEGPEIRVIPPSALALNVQTEPGPSTARKSPVTVQEWVDSLPPPNLREETPTETWPEPPAGVLKREASVQSDAGSHCSSVESLLGSRKPDPEEILIGLGFGGSSGDVDSDVGRIPRRFLRPSKVKGVAIDDFLRHQHDLVQTFESGFSGYRGLTGPGYRPPSVIVGKIMEQLKKKLGGFGLDYPLPTAAQRFSRVARKVINVLPPSSVLTPDNRQFLDDQGGKSPEVPRKKMIIGQRSFTFDHEGHLVELRSAAAKSLSVSSTESEASPITKDNVTSKSISSSEMDNYDSEERFVPNLSSTARSFSLDSTETTEPNSSPINITNLGEISESSPTAAGYSYKPTYSSSSRSASLDSEAQSTANPCVHREVTWDSPIVQRPQRLSSTSISSWESSPNVELDRPFARYESIDETSERGSEANASMEEVVNAVQPRRGSLKRQQHVVEEAGTLAEGSGDSILPVVEEVEVFSSRETLNQSSASDDVASMNSSRMEELLNPHMDSNNKLDRSETFEEPVGSVDELNSDTKNIESHQEVVEEMGGGVAPPLLRARSDSSGFLDLDGDQEAHGELDELVQELTRRGVESTSCVDDAVRLAVTSFGDQLQRDVPAESDLVEARCDVMALRHLRELVATELRRVADLLDEQTSVASLPAVTAQMTALLRQQTRLRRQLESLGDDSSCADAPSSSCSEMFTAVRESHRHLECLVEQNSRELADIRNLLRQLATTDHHS